MSARVGHAVVVRLWERWKRIARALGNLQARVVLSLLYFILIPPFSMVVRTLMDPLRLRRTREETFWIATPEKTPSVSDARRQS